MAAAVAGADAALGEAESIELVEESDKAAGDHAQPGGQRLLRLARVGSQDMENACVGGCEFELRQAFGEFLSSMTAELSEQKSGAEVAGGGRAGGRWLFYGPDRFHESYYCR